MINKSELVSSSPVATQAWQRHQCALPPCHAGIIRNTDHCIRSNKVVLPASHSVTVLAKGILVETQRERRARRLTCGLLSLCLGVGGFFSDAAVQTFLGVWTELVTVTCSVLAGNRMPEAVSHLGEALSSVSVQL